MYLWNTKLYHSANQPDIPDLKTQLYKIGLEVKPIRSWTGVGVMKYMYGEVTHYESSSLHKSEDKLRHKTNFLTMTSTS